MSFAPLAVVTGKPLAGVRYFCTTRHGGVSRGPCSGLNLGLHTSDRATHVADNRRRLGRQLPSQPIWLNQVHGNSVHHADHDQLLSGLPCAQLPSADAVITRQPDKVLAIMTADCLPVLIASSQGDALALAHAGWRGLASGVLENTLAALRQQMNHDTSWHAWIGPAIGQSNFEVGSDVYSAFVDQDAGTSIFFKETVPGKKWLADLAGLARRRLQQTGVDHVECSGLCTYSDPERFYSYRRQANTGRMATLAWIESPHSAATVFPS